MSQIFGQAYAPAYDLLYGEKDYDGETKLLGQLFQKHAAQPVQSILDLGCGTGNHALRLAAQGYHVVGVDRSAQMLAVANRKAREQAGNLHFHEADIRSLDLGQSFDAVVMMFGVLSYQIHDDDVIDALRTARHHLQAGGLFIFDFWYGPAVLSQGTEKRIRSVEQADTTWERTSSGRIDILSGLCHVEFCLRQKKGDHILYETNELHTVRYFFQNDIGTFLESTRFRLLRLGAFPSFDQEPGQTSWNVMALATAS